MRVLMIPHLDRISGESGINTVIRSYFRHLPRYGVELVHPDSQDFDLLHVHAGTTNRYPKQTPIVSSLHGLYWTADYAATKWEWAANAKVLQSILVANEVTVPSSWVNETLQRDMHFSGHVVPHGIDWAYWQHDYDHMGYVLAYAKNRAYFDVSNPNVPTALARKMPDIKFVGTFGGEPTPPNYQVTGVIEHQRMRTLIQKAAVFISPVKETFGIGALEAMASGVPVLTVDRGQVPNIVEHGVSGYCYQPGNIDDMMAGLEYCLTHRKQLSANARSLSRRWTWDDACARLVDVYEAAMAGSHPTVGVVIPVYNKEISQVEWAIDSVKNQNMQPDKIVVVDDGSDNYHKLYELCEQKGVTYIKQDNKGVAHARNRGVEELDTKYVCCLDADDAIKPDFLRMCVNALEGDPTIGIAYTRLEYIDGGRIGVSDWPGEYDFDRFINDVNQIPTCSVYRREIWSRLGGYRQRYAPTGAGAEDAEFYFRAGGYGYRGQLVTNQPLFVYTMGQGHTSKPGYTEVDWRAWHAPWLRGTHPFASRATPKNDISHPVRQYDEPDISVVIPVRPGHEQYLWDALDSLEAQTFMRWEVVVVLDDTSEDHDLPEIERLKRAFPFARFLYNSVLGGAHGAGACRNIGARAARAPFLLFLDADDWLHPDFMEVTLDALEDTGYGIYTDYMGKAFIDDPGKLAQDLQNNLVSYNEKTHEATIRYKAANYDCHRALRQPEGDYPYIWCNITTLIPKAWHDSINGFDETMESWEDVDYWWRMARAGHCFARVHRPLMAYRFYTGGRREEGLRNNQQLLSYLREKKERANDMGCGCSKTVSPVQARASQAQSGPMAALGEVQTTMDDNDLVLIRYTHPNRGQHMVIGPATGRKYYYHGSGDRFLVHRDDVALMPQYFQPIDEIRSVERARRAVAQVAPPPPPPPLVEVEEEDPVPGPVAPVVNTSNDLFDAIASLNLDKRAIASLYQAGVTTVDSALELGVEGLVEVKWIGESRAEEIIAQLDGGSS